MNDGAGTSREHAPRGDVEIRAATGGDLTGILGVLSRAMDRDAADPRFEALYRWKHEENPSGASPAWVAAAGERVVGFRVFMRWTFTQDGDAVRAVRAVDTATDPDYQGRGLFTKLTMHALDAVTADGVAFVFNTPNEQSRPGYLKMGWREVGRLPALFRPRGPGGLLRTLRARAPAERWSEPCDAGEAAADVVADTAALARLADALPVEAGIATRRDAGYLRWRYGTPLLGYRAVVAPGGVEDGVALFRLRRRGAARELALCDVLAPAGDASVRRHLTRAAVRSARADYALALGRWGEGGTPRPFVPLTGRGPLLTCRDAAAAAPAAGPWRLSLGDVELF